MLETFTLICFSVVAYSYILYPLLLRILSSFKADNTLCFSTDDPLPGVSIIMAAYNEDRVIGAKIASILKSSFPSGKIEVLIGSDNSSDKTDAVIKEYAARNPCIRLFPFKTRTGKTGIINELVKHASFDILLLTDANVMFDEHTIFQLVRHFKNPEIALVDSRMMNTGVRKEGISLQEKTYIQAEVYIKHYEGKLWGTMMGPFGGCYAMRRSYFHIVPSYFLVDDFYINMKVMLDGGKCINEISALAFEDAANDPKIEFKRKVRIAAGSFQNLFHFLPVLFKPGAVSFCFLSHKVLRWFGPVFILLFFAGTIGLRDQLPFLVLMTGSIAIFIAPLIDYLCRMILRIHLPFLKFFSHFTTSNVAQLLGLLRYISGIKSGIWEPTARHQ
jgi:cellulose synthase/poly-beta-1,6-N-acetylglucosamine synthase-like glycosyltransferase